MATTPSNQHGDDTADSVQRKTQRYRPRLVSGDKYRRWMDGRPWFSMRDAEAMRRDPQVSFGLRILRSALYQVRTKVTADDARIGQFILQEFRKIWRTSLRQLLSFFEFGICCGEVSYRHENGFVVFDRFDSIHSNDARPLIHTKDQKAGQLLGIRVQGESLIDAVSGNFDLLNEHAFWFAGENEFGQWWSYPRLAGAHEPWLEKVGRGGALEIRRQWFHKGAYSGGVVRHPMSSSKYENADGTFTEINSQDLATQIGEGIKTGSVMAIPSTRDDKGNLLWEYDHPTPSAQITNILDYPKLLDDEILIGLGIPPELVSAATVGSGYSGRAIPAQVFFSSCDEVVALLVKAINEQIIRYLVKCNFGEGVKYDILPDSLAEKIGQDPGTGEKNKEDSTESNDETGAQKPINLSLNQKRRLVRRLEKLERRALGLGRKSKGKRRESKRTELAWTRYVGKNGGRGWQNTDSGKIVYQDSKPGSSDEKKSEAHRVVANKVDAILRSNAPVSHHDAADILDNLPNLPTDSIVQYARQMGITVKGKTKADVIAKIKLGLDQKLSNDRAISMLATDQKSKGIVQQLRSFGQRNQEVAAKEADLQEQITATQKALDARLAEAGARVKAGKTKFASPQAKKLTDKMRADLKKLRDQHTAAKVQQYNLKENQRQELINVLAVENPLKITPIAKPEDLALVKDQNAKAIEFLSKVTDWKDEFQYVIHINDGSRAHADIFDDPPGITVAPNEKATVILHEIAHLVEVKIPGNLEKTVDFLRYRHKGQQPQKLKDIFPDGNFRDEEIGAPDDFAKAFASPNRSPREAERLAYYTGKVYYRQDGTQYATEIITMGVEELFRDPIGFAKRDPEYCQFLLHCLRGGK